MTNFSQIPRPYNVVKMTNGIEVKWFQHFNKRNLFWAYTKWYGYFKSLLNKFQTKSSLMHPSAKLVFSMLLQGISYTLVQTLRVFTKSSFQGILNKNNNPY